VRVAAFKRGPEPRRHGAIGVAGAVVSSLLKYGGISWSRSGFEGFNDLSVSLMVARSIEVQTAVE
jgi:hypothetical protein